MKNAVVACMAAVIVICSAVPPVHAGPDTEMSLLGGLVVTPRMSYDSRSGASAGGIDLNFVQPLYNGGISYRVWDERVPAWDDPDTDKRELGVYVGVGLVNFIQLQAGYSTLGPTLRLRSDLVFGTDFFLFSDSGRRWWVFREGIVLSPFIEASPWSSNNRYVLGLGLGLYF